MQFKLEIALESHFNKHVDLNKSSSSSNKPLELIFFSFIFRHFIIVFCLLLLEIKYTPESYTLRELIENIFETF